ncbi:hypothetical protein CHK_0627 [Christensenella hongkongensis]|uniref:Uncharacterized protein n=1 Tax=Christensenella hongkongensis TaxID=270498 RepID=A0A0M2NHA3_9FIRM|nr:hypothetical protein CHK_0627 [Christensenella hongkongensis]
MRKRKILSEKKIENVNSFTCWVKKNMKNYSGGNSFGTKV